MNDYLIVIPTVPEKRGKILCELLMQLQQQFPAPVILGLQRENETARQNRDRIFGMVINHAVQWILYLEDDIMLSPEFGQCVSNALQSDDANSEKVAAVTFYSNSKKDVVKENFYFRTVAPKQFYGICCLAIKPHIVKSFLDYAPSWYSEHPEHHDAYDLMIGSCISMLKKKILVFVPSQVQHRDTDSLLNHRYGRRKSQSFLEAYGG
jgi:hypothetical protein